MYRSSTLVEHVQQNAGISGFILCEQRWGAGLSRWDNSRSCSAGGNSTFKPFEPRDAPFCALCAIHTDARVPAFILDDGFRKVQQVFEELGAQQPASWGLSNVCVYFYIFIFLIKCIIYTRIIYLQCVLQSHLANTATMNAASAFLRMTGKKELRFIRSCCVVHSTRYSYVPTSKEIADLRMIGCVVDEFDVQGFKVANIMGVQFRAGKK